MNAQKPLKSTALGGHLERRQGRVELWQSPSSYQVLAFSFSPILTSWSIIKHKEEMLAEVVAGVTMAVLGFCCGTVFGLTNPGSYCLYALIPVGILVVRQGVLRLA